MAQIVNNNKLNLIITDYGLGRIAEALKEPTLNLMLSKIKLGSGRNHEYYEPSSTQESLEGPLGIEFFIYDKELLEDGMTISFHTVIPESSGGYDIREVGLYESVDGEDKLFAICTQQPFVKPSSDDFYFINLDYYIFLKEENFAEIYDQITLDPMHSLATAEDLEGLMRTFLFAHGNLIDQIGNNSKIIGYNRATQLYKNITENRKNFSYITLFKNFTSLIDMLTSPDNVFSYWAFDYTDKNDMNNSIQDLSNHGYFLSTNKPVTAYEKTYSGFMSTLAFRAPDYFNLSYQIPLDLYDEVAQQDVPFTMVFVLEPIVENVKRTLLAKSNYATGTHSFEVSELSNRSLEVKLFSSSQDYLTFTSLPYSVPSGKHSIVLTYDPETLKMTAYINSTKHELQRAETGDYTHINESLGLLYAFECSPQYTIYSNNNVTPTELYNIDGSPYEGTSWVIANSKVLYKGEVSAYTPSKNAQTDKLFACVPSGTTVYDHIIYTKTETISSDTILYKENYQIEDMSTSPFSIAQSGSSYVILYNGEQTERRAQSDIEPKIIFCFEYAMTPQYIWTNNPNNPTILYTFSGDFYKGTDWSIQNNRIYYMDMLASRDSSKDKEVVNPDITSFITDANGNMADFINANVGIVSIVREKLSSTQARLFALLLCATIGKNPYLGGSM